VREEVRRSSTMSRNLREVHCEMKVSEELRSMMAHSFE
jgi:hypothetical protein